MKWNLINIFATVLLLVVMFSNLSLGMEGQYVTFEGTIIPVHSGQPDWDILFITQDEQIYTLSGIYKEQFMYFIHLRVCITGMVQAERLSQTNGDIAVEN